MPNHTTAIINHSTLCLKKHSQHFRL